MRERIGSPFAKPVVSTYRTVVEDKGGGCVDGRRTRVGRWIDFLARVQLQGLELGFPAKTSVSAMGCAKGDRRCPYL
jgi:hypothetical protein